MRKKSATKIKEMYVNLINSAPDTLTVGDIDMLFICLYWYVKEKISRTELIETMKCQVISGLAMAYLIEEIEKKKTGFARYTLPGEYGLS